MEEGELECPVRLDDNRTGNADIEQQEGMLLSAVLLHCVRHQFLLLNKFRMHEGLRVEAKEERPSVKG